MWEPDLGPPVLPSKSQAHPQPCFPHCAAPLAPSTLSQSAPTLGRKGSTGGLYAHHNVAELTLCLWLATAAVQRRRRRALGPQTDRKNTAEEEKRKRAARLMACFDRIPASPKWMIADYLWLSVQVRNNCSFCEYLTGDICLNCSFGTNLQPPLSETHRVVFFFSVFMKTDVIIFAMFAQASLYSSSTGNPYFSILPANARAC